MAIPEQAMAIPTPNRPSWVSTLHGSAASASRCRSTIPDIYRHISSWLTRPICSTAKQYQQWLETLTDDIHYVMPVRVTTALGAGFDTSPGMAHFDENKYSLSRRVARFLTEHAWTEDPPSRLRHHITNVRTFAADDDHHLIVESAELLFRSRGDVNEAALVSCGREDLLREAGGEWRLARRIIFLDESVLRMQNLAVFL